MRYDARAVIETRIADRPRIAARLACVGVLLLACRTPAADPSVASPQTPAPTDGPLAADQSGWAKLWAHLGAEHPDLDLGKPPASDAEARGWLCTFAEKNSCAGAPPWIVLVRSGDGSWVHHVVDVAPQGLVSSEAFGKGGLARCAASTAAALVRERGELRVVVEDYLEFPEEVCGDCEDDEDCTCETACGTPIEARCTFTVAPQTLVFGKPDAECSAYEIGTAAGHDY